MKAYIICFILCPIFSSDEYEQKKAAKFSTEGDEEDGFRDLVRHTMFEKGQSKRIWGELYKVVDSSDVVVQVSNSRPSYMKNIRNSVLQSCSLQLLRWHRFTLSMHYILN